VCSVSDEAHESLKRTLDRIRTNPTSDRARTALSERLVRVLMTIGRAGLSIQCDQAEQVVLRAAADRLPS